MRITVIILAILVYVTAAGQTKEEFVINEKHKTISNLKSIENAKVLFKVYDSTTLQRLSVIIVKIDKISVVLYDTVNHSIFVNPGIHKISFGNVGYKWTKPKKFKASLDKEYEIIILLEQLNALLE
jgi:hypothetical protein